MSVFAFAAGAMRRAVRDREALRAGLLYLAVLAGVFAPVVFAARSLQAPLYYPLGLTREGPLAAVPRKPVNAFNVDLATPAYYEHPLNKVVGRAYRTGQWPLWNPYQGTGGPLAAQYSTRAFFPYQILIDVLPHAAWDFLFLGRLWIAGFFTFLFLRRAGAGPPSAFLAGLLYMLSGTFVWFINLEQMVNVAMVAPLLLWGVERLWAGPWTRGVPALGVAIALVFLAGQPEVALFVFILGTAYALYRVAGAGRGDRLGKLTQLAAATVVGMCLAAPLLLPFIDCVRASHHIHPAGGDMGVPDVEDAKLFKPISIAMPSHHYRPTAHRALPDNGRWDWVGGYLGMTSISLTAVGLFLAVFLPAAPWKRPFAFFLAFGLTLMLKNFGVDWLQWIGRLPLLDQAWGPRWSSPAWTLPLSICAGLTLEGLAQLARDGALRPAFRNPWDRWGRPVAARLAVLRDLPLRHALWIAVFGALSTRAIWYLRKVQGDGPDLNPFMPLTLLLSTSVSFLAVTSAVGVVAAAWACVRRDAPPGVFAALAVAELGLVVPLGYDGIAWLARLVPYGLVLGGAYALARRRPGWAAAHLAVAGLLVLVIDRTSRHGPPDRIDPTAPTTFTRYLEGREGHPRVMGGLGVLMPNTAGAVGLHDVHYINALTDESLFEFTSRHLLQHPLWPDSPGSLWFTGNLPRNVDLNGIEARLELDFGQDFLAKHRYYSLLGVRYVVTPRDYLWPAADTGTADPAQFPVVYHGEVKIFENPAAFPRAWVVHDLRVAASHAEALDLVGHPDIDLRGTAVVEGPLPPAFRDAPARLAAAPGRGASRAQVLSIGYNRARVEAHLDKEGLLVLSDAYAEGWRAEANGAPVDIVRVDGLLRGVLLPAGTHRVVFRYFPRSFGIGLGLAGAAALLCGACLAASFRRRVPAP